MTRAILITVTMLTGGHVIAADHEFARDIRPVFSDACYNCHGPDANARKAKLRLDVRDSAVSERKGGLHAIKPGDIEESELIYRILSDDTDEIMPPPESKLKLTIAQKATLKKWVAEGAEYESHWAYVRPVRHALPQVKDPKQVRNAIDNFIFAELEKRNWKLSAEADRHATNLDIRSLV